MKCVTEKNNIKQKEEKSNFILDFSDNTSEEEIFFQNNDEINIELDFEKMNKEEQNDLISKIKNSNL